MSKQVEKEVVRETGEGTDLWRVIIAPIIWAVHFLMSYLVSAVYCEKAGRFAELFPARAVIAVITIAALVGIGLAFRSLWKVKGFSTVNENFDYSGNSPEERHRFLSHVALMLCLISTIAIIYTSIPAMVLESCR